MQFSAIYWHNHIKSTLFVELDKVVEILQNRIAPQFANIEAEADEIQRETWDGLTSSSFDGDDDPSDFMGSAFNAGFDHYSLMHGLRQGVVNLFAASIFHLHEQHLMIFYKRQILDPGHKLDMKKFKPVHVIKELKKLGIEVEALQSWASLKEVEDLANVIKHGEGISAESLRKKRPEFFIDPQIPQELNFGATLHVEKPILGEGIYVSSAHLVEIKQTIKTFWNDFFDLLIDHEKST